MPNAQLANVSLEDLVAEVVERTTVYKEAAEILDVHPTYARRMVEEKAGEGELISLHGHPIISRQFLSDLNEARAQKAADREAAKEEAAAEKERKAAEREANKAQKDAAAAEKAAAKPAKRKKKAAAADDGEASTES